MKKRLLALLCATVLLAALPVQAQAAKNTEDIVILYENDPHCEVEGYSKLSAMKKQLQERYEYVGVVSGGDYIRGNTLGTVSEGEYIIDLMNLVGYDAVTLGNHEFGYLLDRLDELVAMMDTKPVCCNFRKLDEADPYYAPYSMVTYGGVKVAYIGITTPDTLTVFPTQFKNEEGEYLYTFHPNDLYELVQENIDAARAAGADYVIALSHIGLADEELDAAQEDVVDLIANTEGLDVVLDAHSHSVIEGELLPDKGGNRVLLSSTGTKFAYIGKLTLSQGACRTELIPVGDELATDPVVDAYLEKLYSEYGGLTGRRIAGSEVDLITQDGEGNRLVRLAETNLGDLCAEAFRSAMGADIGFINGGAIRADIPAGDITFNHLLGVLPFNNTVVMVQVSGQTVIDLLEMGMMSWPGEDGNFPHLSGLTFRVNTDIPSSVVLDEQEEFVEVSGEYRVYDLQVYNRRTERYEPLRPEGQYTIASHNYALLDHGSGMTMLKDSVILRNDGLLDVEALEHYIVEELNGVVEEERYGEVTPNITFVTGEEQTVGSLPWIGGAAAALLAAGVILLLVRRGRAEKK